MENEKQVVEVRDIERELYGYTGGEFEYTPAVFKSMDIPEEKWFSLTVKPLTDEDCTLIRHINDNIKTELYLWAGEKGIDISNIENDAMSLAFYQKASTLDDPTEKFKIVLPYLSKLKNHKAKKLTPDVWISMPNKIREDIYNKVVSISNVSVSISNVSVGETINLS
jgi:hypothetical protein